MESVLELCVFGVSIKISKTNSSLWWRNYNLRIRTRLISRKILKMN